MIRDILQGISLWAIPVLLVGIPLVGLIRGVKVYDVFIEGAKEGFNVAIRIIPFLVGILVAIGMFRASGAMD
ncbi:MAG: spore maturation protein, partial [Thermoanaerobaculia bacterium]